MTGRKDPTAATDNAPPAIGIVIVNYNSEADLRDCLAALREQTLAPAEVVVVDNASADGSLDLAAAEIGALGATVLRQTGNTGFAGGVNIGAADIASPWIATLNPDALPEPDWLAALATAIARYPGTAMFGSTQVRADAPEILDGAGDSYHALGLAWRGAYGWPRSAVEPRDAEVFAPCAAAAVYDAALFRAAGGLAEGFFCYLEDVDLGLRLRLRGGRAIQVAAAIVRHKGGAAGGRPAGFEAFHAMRNGIWCFVRNMPGPIFWPLFPASLLIHGLFALRGGPAARRGWRAGVAGLRGAFAERRRIQRCRRAGTGELARWLVWSAGAVRRRAPKRRPVG